MEITKGFVFNRGQVELDGVKKHAYLVGAIIILDEPLKNLSNNKWREKENLGGRGETFIVGAVESGFGDVIQSLQKYEPPFALGDASSAFHQLQYLNPEDLDLIKRNK